VADQIVGLVPMNYATKPRLWGNHFWARGYFVDTVGVNEKVICRYVRHQDKQDIEYEQQL
ncbi:transposase, partial [Vibrio sp. 10N.261.49.A11]|uniref:transposase n=1 Tax=Vibrio sp. 10N.261.49.A11 TaxID=3229666 RepID=UPI0035539D64